MSNSQEEPPAKKQKISLEDQHAFLDLAKDLDFEAVALRLEECPGLVNWRGGEAMRWSVLHQAALSGSLDAVEFLVEKRANINALTKDRKTALDIAKEQDDGEMQEFLQLNGSRTCESFACS